DGRLRGNCRDRRGGRGRGGRSRCGGRRGRGLFEGGLGDDDLGLDRRQRFGGLRRLDGGRRDFFGFAARQQPPEKGDRDDRDDRRDDPIFLQPHHLVHSCVCGSLCGAAGRV